MLKRVLNSCASFGSLRRLKGDESAVSTIEFAMILPLFVGLGLTGVESVSYTHLTLPTIA